MDSHGTIEVLESRIAPALFLVSSTALAISTAAGGSAQDSANETAAQNAALSGRAVLLSAGDALLYDANANQVIDGGDPLLFSVTSGKAMVFMTDLNHNGRFEAAEISGLAVSDGFAGLLKTDVQGPIATALTTSGAFTVDTQTGKLSLQDATIQGLSSVGAVQGYVVSGGEMENIALGAAFNGAGTLSSTAGLLTGTGRGGHDPEFWREGFHARLHPGGGSLWRLHCQRLAGPGHSSYRGRRRRSGGRCDQRSHVA